MVENIITVIAAVVGTVGFSFMLRLRKHRLPIIAVSTAICYSIYLLGIYLSFEDFISNFLATVFAAFASEFLARKFKAPVTVFLIPTILPLVPGSSLYYTIEAVFKSDFNASLIHFAALCSTIGAILLGIITVNTIMKFIHNYQLIKNHR